MKRENKAFSAAENATAFENFVQQRYANRPDPTTNHDKYVERATALTLMMSADMQQ